MIASIRTMKSMRTAAFAITALAASASVDQPALAASVGFVGKNFEAYTDQQTCNEYCTHYFPLNTTGQVIKLETINCLVTTEGSFVFGAFGPTLTAPGSFIKVSQFDTLISTPTNVKRYTLSADTGMLMGANRYLGVFVQTNTSTGFIVQCSAFGVAAQ